MTETPLMGRLEKGERAFICPFEASKQKARKEDKKQDGDLQLRATSDGTVQNIQRGLPSHPIIFNKSSSTMDGWIVSQVSFWYTVRKVKPAAIVDSAIKFFLDIVVPGRGAGENSWFMRGWRSLEQSAERSSREMDIRTELRRWDNEFPEIHHELIVRWLSGALVSVAVSSLYNALKPQPRSPRKF